MSDYISRQAAIDGKIIIQLSNGVEIYSDEAVPVDYLKHLPSAELPIKEKCCVCPYCDNCDVNEDGTIESKKVEWIPCSERLPEMCGYYLVTKYKEFGNIPVLVDCDFYFDESWCCNGDVIAWMPRPEPYTEEGEVDE